MTPTVLVMVPAKKPTMAKQPYKALFAELIKVMLELMDPPAPKPDKALNMPGPHNETIPKSTI